MNRRVHFLPYRPAQKDFTAHRHPNSPQSRSTASAAITSQPTHQVPVPILRKPLPLALVRITIFTFGRAFDRPQPPYPTVMDIDCSRLTAPPRSLCDRFTGLDPVIAADFFSQDVNVAVYESSLDVLRSRIEAARYDGIEQAAVLVSCMLGVHRSVALAEALGKQILDWGGVKVTVEHLDLGREMRRRERESREGRGRRDGFRSRKIPLR